MDDITKALIIILSTTVVIFGGQWMLEDSHLDLNQTYYSDNLDVVMDCIGFDSSWQLIGIVEDDMYICEDRKLIQKCNKLSQYILPNGKCWNEEVGNRICKTGDGWTFKNYTEINTYLNEETICLSADNAFEDIYANDWALVTKDMKETFKKYDRQIFFDKLEKCDTEYWNTSWINYTYCHKEKWNETTHKYDNYTYICGNKTIIVQHNKTTCIDIGQAIVTIQYKDYKEDYVFLCDYFDWGNCGYNLKDDNIQCDNKFNSNQDGICTGAEECITLFNDTNKYPITMDKVDRYRNPEHWVNLNKNNVECVII